MATTAGSLVFPTETEQLQCKGLCVCRPRGREGPASAGHQGPDRSRRSPVQGVAPKSSVGERRPAASLPPDTDRRGRPPGAVAQAPGRHTRCKDHSPTIEVYSSHG